MKMTRKIIFLNGPAGSGKDTVGKSLGLYLPAYAQYNHVMKFSEPLKRQVAEILGLSKEEQEFYFETQEGKSFRSERFNGMTPRQALIQHSEEFAKKIGGQDVFGKYAAKKIRDMLNRDTELRTITFTDSGFVPEAQAVINAFGDTFEYWLVRLHRDGCTFAGDSRGYLDAPIFKNVLDIENNSAISITVNEIKEKIYGENK